MPHTSDIVILARYLDIAEIALLVSFLLLILRGLLVSASDGALGIWLGLPHVGRDDEMAAARGGYLLRCARTQSSTKVVI